MTLHHQRCRNGCTLFEPDPSQDDPCNIVGFCKAYGGYTAVHWDTEIFMKIRGCCMYTSAKTNEV